MTDYRKLPYHSALHGDLDGVPEVQKHVFPDGSVAMVNDMMTGVLPEEFNQCDVLYAEPPWRAGFEKFNSRAGADMTGKTYKDLLAGVSRIINTAKVPSIVIAGKAMFKDLPEPDSARLVTLNGFDAFALVYGIELTGVSTKKPVTVDVVEWLARTYDCIGDFCCGYGVAGTIFHRAGKRFVMADYNAKCIGYIAQTLGGE